MSLKPGSSPEWAVQIRRLLQQRKLSQAALASRLGVSPATITRWVKGTHEPTSASYIALGNLAGQPGGVYFWERAGIEPAQMAGTAPRPPLSSLRVNLADYQLIAGRKLSSAVIASHAAVILPLLNITAYGDRIPPGPHVTLAQAKVVDVLMAPLSWCPHPESMLCMSISGDSMTPLISPDSIIAVDAAVTERQELDKKLAVFSHRDLGFKVARLQRMPSTEILVSANHTCLPIEVSDHAKWKLVGAVLWWVSRDSVPTDPPRNSPAR
jgi:transcriptional regulator with XRE-family HTH domain